MSRTPDTSKIIQLEHIVSWSPLRKNAKKHYFCWFSLILKINGFPTNKVQFFHLGVRWLLSSCRVVFVWKLFHFVPCISFLIVQKFQKLPVLWFYLHIQTRFFPFEQVWLLPSDSQPNNFRLWQTFDCRNLVSFFYQNFVFNEMPKFDKCLTKRIFHTPFSPHLCLDFSHQFLLRTFLSFRKILDAKSQWLCSLHQKFGCSKMLLNCYRF